MKVHVLGIDLAKNVFQLHGVDRKGRPILVRRVRREQLLRNPWRTGAVPHRHRSLHRRILLAAAVREARSRGKDHGAAVREALCPQAEERFK